MAAFATSLLHFRPQHSPWPQPRVRARARVGAWQLTIGRRPPGGGQRGGGRGSWRARSRGVAHPLGLLLVAPPLLVAPGAVFRVSCAASCPTACGALTSCTPWPVGAPPSFLATAVGRFATYHFAAPSHSPAPRAFVLGLVASCSSYSRSSVVAYAWARGRSSALCATTLGQFVACSSAAVGRSSALCVVFRRCCGASCSAALEVPLSLIPGLVGAPPPPMCRLVGAALPSALPLPVAPRLRALSFLVAALPRAPCSWASATPLLGLVGAPPPFM